MRKIIVGTVLFFLVPTYTFSVAFLSNSWAHTASEWERMLFFAASGLLWVIPAAALVWWGRSRQ